MGGNYRKGMSAIVHYFNIRITLANGKVIEGIRESDIRSRDLMERIYKNKAELHYKETYVTEISITELSSKSMAVKLYLERNKK